MSRARALRALRHDGAARGPKPQRALRALLAALPLLLGAALALPSCAKDLNATEVNKCAFKDVFEQSVSPYMERRCATLDCHGATDRNMRLYGQLGLRHPDETNIPGGKATTQIELDANYDAVCNIEPEKMNGNVEDLGNSAETLLIVRKARGEIKHKGGKVVSSDGNDPGDQCIVRWLQLSDSKDAAGKKAVADACQAAVSQLK